MKTPKIYVAITDGETLTGSIRELAGIFHTSEKNLRGYIHRKNKCGYSFNGKWYDIDELYEGEFIY